MTRLLAEQTAASLEAVDLILRAVQGKTASEIVAIEPKLRDELARIPQIAELTVFDARGRGACALGRHPGVRTRRAGTAVRRRASHGAPDLLHLGEPYRVAPGGQWRFVLSRRLNNGGGFGGVVAAAIDVDGLRPPLPRDRPRRRRLHHAPLRVPAPCSPASRTPETRAGASSRAGSSRRASTATAASRDGRPARSPTCACSCRPPRCAGSR